MSMLGMTSRFVLQMKIQMLAKAICTCNNLAMCEFNSPYPMSFRNRSDHVQPRSEPTVLPPDSWSQRESELPADEASAIQRAVEEAAAIGADVHLRRAMGSQALEISLSPGTGPNVKIWEH